MDNFIDLDSEGIKILETAAHIQQFITVGKGNRIKFWSIDQANKLICRGQFKIKGEVITSAVYCHFQPTILVGTDTGKILVYGKKVPSISIARRFSKGIEKGSLL